MNQKYAKESVRWNTKCVHKCPCGVEMVGIEPDLEGWLHQHLYWSKIHKQWALKMEMDLLEVQVMIDKWREGGE
jgi:hypothetical protein